MPVPESQPHVLLVTFPAQGHINPSLQFAKRLIHKGLRVTLATCLSAVRRINASSSASFPDGLSVATFSDGYDEGVIPEEDRRNHLSVIRRRGPVALSELIVANENAGTPFTWVVYTLLMTWTAEVARAHHLPWTLLWIQPATVLLIYYYYFNGYSDLFNQCSDPSYQLHLPAGLPPLVCRDLPSFCAPSDLYPDVLSAFQEQFETLGEDNNARILVNTFDALEPVALKAIEKFKLVGIGPLLPSAYLDGKDPSDTSFGGDLFKSSSEYVEFLNSKPKSSVVYISFGSIIVLTKKQKEEIASALLKSERPFLWVIRKDPYQKQEEEEVPNKEELEKRGMIVQWCSQVKVLSHESVGGFVTHCGWNSTLEGLVSGVPMVAFPQWTDQGTNAKLIEDVWRSGVRVKADEQGFVGSEEIKRCLDLVMGDDQKCEEIRKNAEKWKYLAREAVRDGGSSDLNLKAFVDDINNKVH